MSRQAEKTNLLDSAGYAYNFDRMMYINRHAKKAFSVEFIDDHPEDEIASKIQEPNVNQDWEFYTNSDLPEGIRKELKRVLQ
jgi:hypothetical protein